MKHLFQVSIGPVQDFIASARRTGDLQFGSWLLSELAKAAAKSITGDNHLERLIFPAPESIDHLADTGTLLNVANKIVAIIDDPPKTAGKAVREAIDTRLLNIQQRAYHGMGPIDDEKANKQINDLVECFWVAVPYDEQTQAYVETRHTLEAIMAARKNTRDFSKVEWGSNEPKSSIDGQLEGVIPDDKYYQGGDSVKREKKSKALYIDYEAKPAERLSGVDLLKRRGHPLINGAPVENFPSTSHMATLPFLARLDLLPKTVLPDIQKKWNEYIRLLGEIALSPTLEQIPYTFPPHAILKKYDGSLLFEERLVDMISTPVSPTDQPKFQAAKKALRDFYDEVDTALGKAPPSPYYAILRADGDRMGKAIDNQKDAESHRKLSRALDSFADRVRKIVETHKGALIYAGGDDVLAFVPLHTLLICARDLHQMFDKRLGSFTDAQSHKPTLSVGIVIVHHLDSLQDSLNLARAAENKAKDVKGKNGLQDKNGLAITVSKRGGIDYSVVGQWGEIDEDQKTIKREGIDTYIDQLIPFCIDDSIPDGMAYELRDLAQRIAVPKENKDFDMLQKVIQAEAKRILERKLAPLTEAKKKEVMAVLGPKLGIEGEKTDTRKATAIKLEDFTNELLLAQLLADTQKLVTLKKEQAQ